MAKRVFEVARELGVTSKAMLEKLQAEGLDISNHMSTLSAGLEATVRDWFSEEATGTAVETTEHVDLESARAEAARKKRRRAQRKKEEAQAAEAEAVEAEQAAAEAPAAEQAEAAETAESAETAEIVEKPEELPAETAEPEEAVAEAPAAEEIEIAEITEIVEKPEELPTEPAAEKPAEVTEGEDAEEEGEEGEEGEEEGEQGETPEQIKPAGPQVVPQPARLKGPKVVRMDRPEHVPAPPPRSRGPQAPSEPTPSRPARGGGKLAAQKEEEEESRKKKSKRRSPRRRGRSADSGEKLKEWREKDLVERSARLAAAGGGLRRRRATVRGKRSGRPGEAQVHTGKVEIEEPITVKSLSAATGLKGAEIIKKLMEFGVMATVNQSLTTEQAEMVCADYDIAVEVQRQKTAEEEMLQQVETHTGGEQVSRAPVVTFLGHVDHGKTSLLDWIRQTSVAEGEAGGITQHIGSYRYDVGDKHVVFLDTPGHEAFTAMRARGANMTDVVVLVVAADDGVMPQTVEAINHARAAEVPIIVALNKIDLPNANINRVLGQLAEHDLQPQEWGGDTEVIKTSATTGEGMDELVETLSLEAEILELTADPTAPGRGFVVESEMSPGRGVLARLLVRDGTLRVGDVVAAGLGYGRVRQIIDSHGKDLDEAGPSTPVEMTGLDTLPEAGDKFYALEDLDTARSVAEDRRQSARAKELASTPARSLEDLLGQIEAGEANELPLVIKADVQGSVEALRGQLDRLSTDEVRVNILHIAVGGISTGDVALAEASDAIIIGFNVVADPSARKQAEKLNVDIRLYRVIYDIVEDVRKALEEGLAPEIREETLGRAEIRQTFKVSRVGTIAGCFITDGVVNRNAKLRVTRDNVVIEDERSLESLKRFKDDVREVRSGMECGLKIAGYDDIKEGDVLEFYRKVEVSRTL